MYACTGASPSAFAIWGFPPESSFGFADFFAGDFRTAVTRERTFFFSVFRFFVGIFAL